MVRWSFYHSVEIFTNVGHLERRKPCTLIIYVFLQPFLNTVLLALICAVSLTRQLYSTPLLFTRVDAPWALDGNRMSCLVSLTEKILQACQSVSRESCSLSMETRAHP